MCGIIGYFGLNEKKFTRKVDLNLISHRGPDNKGSFHGQRFYLGHTRLSILDLTSRGNQPMLSKDKKYAIIFNGEIYNHNELRENILTDVNFISNSDTETLLYGLIKYGETFLNKINGIFCFAFIDLSSGNFIVARDFFGIKPLYYHLNNSEFFFSSELKAISPHLNKKTLNINALRNYINFLWSPGEITPINEIMKLKPGNLVSGNLNSIKNINFKRYYKIQFPTSFDYSIDNEDLLIDKLENKLINVVKRQLLSDAPVGFFLSGGLDSSLIVAIAKKINPEKNFECFTIKSDDFKDEGFSDDLHYAKKVSKYLDVNLNIVDGEKNIIEFFDDVIYFLDEPQADPASINVYNITKLARAKGIKVLLGGTGGDDIFSGYRRHKALRLEKIYDYMPKFLRIFIKFILVKINCTTPIVRRLKKLTKDLDKSKEERFFGYFDWIDNITLNSIFLNKNLSDKHDFFRELDSDLPKGIDDLNRILYYEINSFLVDHNLNYTDKLSMANGVEVRVPYLDKELFEFSLSISPDLKMKGNTTKYILKKVAERYLPKDVIYRSKTGFGAPVRKWIKNDMDFLIDKYLNKEIINKRNIFNYEKIEKLIVDNKNGKIDSSYSIWGLLTIESWIRQFMK